jgi:flavin reductase (DIM6/NTAB) family NADH-FMN oxidoreductase RutF
MSVDAQSFKQALAQFGSGVTIVTTGSVEQPVGVTVSAFMSVSLTPPLVLVSLAHELYTRARIEQTGVFAVNILAETQIEWGQRFAGLLPEALERFVGIELTTAMTGSPILPGVSGWVDCRATRLIPAGDHTLILGEVQAVGSAGHAPLLYHNRRWGHFSPHA